ncbi:sensor histidine kinase [Rhodanobacter aciditrophus]|uniref:histidine kinase n=1 Tax=Rhodanobacter aciditrophus TaxID=1623218 RepID=A0ABW4AZT4_9GAMM
MALTTSKRIAWIGIAWCVLSIFIAIGVGKLSKDLGYQALHDEVSDRLLASIHRVRGALNAFHYLPFLLTQNEDVIQLVDQASGLETTELADKVSRYLEQTNLVAGASGLFIVSQTGRTVAYSDWRDQQSLSPSNFAQLPLFQLAERGEEGRFYENPPHSQAFYYLSAPIYKQTQFVGAAIVRIDLEQLLPDSPPDEWFAISDDSDVIFIASQPEWLRQLKPNIADQSSIPLSNGINASLWTIERQHFITQSVRLDDLGWTFTTLVSARSNERYSNMLATITVAVLWILGVLMLYLRERQLKKISQQETRTALARSAEQQRYIISNAEVGLVTLNKTGHIRFINPKAAQQFNLSPEQAIGQPIGELLTDVPSSSALGRALSQFGQEHFIPVVGAEARGVRQPDQTFPALISLRVIHHLPEYEYLATVVDISRRKQLEQALLTANESLEQKVQERTQALENAQQELVQTSKMAALGRMSTAVVHELNQPLTAMRTYIAISRQLLNEPDMVKENLTLLDDLTERMAVITSQLKTFAYKKPEHVHPVSLSTAISQTQMLLRQRLEQEAVTLDIQGINPEHSVLGDNARVEQVLVNLVSNACDALEATPEKCIRMASQATVNQLILTVEDNGPGIAPDHQEQLFEPFFTTKSIGSGLGLGLAIVAAIIRDLKGTIRVDKSPMGGARFTLVLSSANTID